jgi:ketosteroid isomerase-like protein
VLINAVVAMIVLSGCALAQRGVAVTDTAQVRNALEAQYEKNIKAYERADVEAIMALRAPHFHTVTPNGRTQDRAAMESYTRGFLNGVKQWNRQTITIDSLRVSGDTAFAIVSQHLDRMALRPDDQVHHIETWVTQRETWIHVRGAWLLWRVDQLRNQRRMVDGKPAERPLKDIRLVA